MSPTGIEIAGFFLLALVVIGLAGVATFLLMRIWQRRGRPTRVLRIPFVFHANAKKLARARPYDWNHRERALAVDHYITHRGLKLGTTVWPRG